MNQCEHIAGLLPWLLNGTLDADERRQVRQHLAECGHCQREFDETALAFAVHGQHVSAEWLADYAFDRRANGVDIGLLEDHLAACEECSEQVALARESRRWAETQDARPDAASSPVAEKNFWQSLRLWQAGALAACLIGAISIAGWFLTWRQSQNEQALLIAQHRDTDDRLNQLLAANEKLRQSIAPDDPQLEQSRREIARLESRVAELSSPQINALTLDVYPQDFIRRSGQNAVNEIEIPRGVTTVSLILNSQSSAVASDLSLEIVNAGGATVWRAQNLQRHATNDYTINLPADFLPPGNYVFNVYGQDTGRRVKLDSYQIRIRRRR